MKSVIAIITREEIQNAFLKYKLKIDAENMRSEENKPLAVKVSEAIQNGTIPKDATFEHIVFNISLNNRRFDAWIF